MKHRQTMLFLLLSAGLAAPLTAKAQQGPGFGLGPGTGMGHHGPGHAGDGVPAFLRGIELTEAQQDKVFAATYAQEPLLHEQKKIAFKAHAQLRALAASAQYDDAQAATLANTAAQATARISLEHARLEQQLLALLTPEQRTQLAARQARHEGGPGRQGQRPRPPAPV
ncbi:Spy/CpxP family protein refolding chaperone [Janthinobacterium sp. Mn2066]|uniref:Spy/CpxP family protein refolding chaperone n=1 Tax=Janthinobacterium sp. Mn2066 TaxID=3395264 RepID=UPI003BD659FC